MPELSRALRGDGRPTGRDSVHLLRLYAGVSDSGARREIVAAAEFYSYFWGHQFVTNRSSNATGSVGWNDGFLRVGSLERAVQGR